MGPLASEFVEAKNLMRVVRLHESQYPVLRWLHAIPNGGHRGKAAAGKAKAEGVRAGVADYFLPAPASGCHGLYIELKRRDGRPSREQMQFLADMRALGYRAEVAQGWDKAWALICEYLDIKPRGTE